MSEAKSMIVLYHPDMPGGETKGQKHIGYWDDSDFPGDPEWHQTYQDKGRDLPRPQDFVDDAWDAAERAAVVQYLKAGEEAIAWRGYSYCRMCEASPGTTCRTDGEWVWPEGFAHYVEVHNVRPPAEFVQKVLAASPGEDRG